jgi:hypothetical protein
MYLRIHGVRRPFRNSLAPSSERGYFWSRETTMRPGCYAGATLSVEKDRDHGGAKVAENTREPTCVVIHHTEESNKSKRPSALYHRFLSAGASHSHPSARAHNRP